jgi:hypothetical protein
MAGVYRGILRDMKDTYNDTFLIQLKAKLNDIDRERVSWDSIISDNTIEDELKADFLVILETKLLKINSYREKLFAFSKIYYSDYNKTCISITQAEEFYKELESSDEVDEGEDDVNIKSVRNFKSELDKSLNMLLNKRRNISSYSLTIEWFKKIYLAKVGSETKKILLGKKDKISFWKNGDILYDAVNKQLIITSKIYDKDGNEVRTEESKPNEDINKEDIYYFKVKNKDGEDKLLVFDIATRKVGRNAQIHLKITTRFIDE